MTAAPRFTEPAYNRRPFRSHRFDVFSPKLQRQVTLYGRHALDLWTTLEGSPQVLSYCERPLLIPHTSPARAFDFWVRRSEGEEFLVMLREGERKSTEGAEEKSATSLLEGKSLDGAIIRCLDPSDMDAHRTSLMNWGTIIRDLSAFERFIPAAIYKDLSDAIAPGRTIHQLQIDLGNYDDTMVRLAVYALLHRGHAVCRQLATHPLAPDLVIEAP